ncbi:flavodoxin [Dysgonomonas gadei]|uniref:Flavodoxin n=1 Tax=Dysgonomonas gadei ATCC BAA-286 TaxID=742766 RepID=F5ITU5_9BACT|nr:flavodoxin [Dysgonomonas gadei]EGJ99188.1 flavodoxin [Dysgonomonas gadei ATCC BAA-286]
MSKIAIIYATSRGKTAKVAELIKEKVGNADIFNIKESGNVDIKPYDVLFLGNSSTGHGDIQQSWLDILPTFSQQHFAGKKVALFDLGNSAYHKDTFCAGMSHLYKALKDKVNFVGRVSVDGYAFEASDSVVDGKFVGLALDEDNESDKTDTRLTSWIKSLAL